ncbi:RluA family pseudouridine synthase [Candidatus Endowatersipora endosymbiont of Watersipora subatra]|uniref:RluA family pseudouridine synthase n=1 Tax=Candidatus Endowatersipora endosymbiont of Watersipora subatra TaxID=3077946 RepID=UPI00312CABD2
MDEFNNNESTVTEVLVVPHECNGKRIDLFISEKVQDHISRARVQTLLRKGFVTINGVKPRRTRTKIACGDTVRLSVPKEQEAIPKPEKISLDILYEDEDLIIINKPSGMVVHPAPGNGSGTLVNALLYHCNNSLLGIGEIKRPGIVHRLDKDTSGAIVIAKSYVAYVDLKKQFADHSRIGFLDRSYLAIVWGKTPCIKGTIKSYLGRHSNNRLQRAIVNQSQPDAKYAITHYSVKERMNHPKRPGDFLMSLVECRLETGRTHQIRVHMTHIGNPLLGDYGYGNHFSNKVSCLSDHLQPLFSRFRRPALHAKTLSFQHPRSKKRCEFQASIPHDMQTIFSALEWSI